MGAATLGILTLNVGSPSTSRAERQLGWLQDRPEGIFVLTETSNGDGSRLLAERLAGAGWDVRFPEPDPGERGVLIASRVRLKARGTNMVDYLPSRAETVAVGDLDVIGLYVPSRDASIEKVERKQRFLAAVSNAIATWPEKNAIAIGDFNILEPVHIPRWEFFRDWEYRYYEDLIERGWVDAFRISHPSGMEYSWVSHDNKGFRFDHVFVTRALEDRVVRCEYVHETRETKITDHSALTIDLISAEIESLDVEESFARGSLTLF